MKIINQASAPASYGGGPDATASMSGFTWILAPSLAGSAQPGLLDELDGDLELLRERGITRIVSLTERPLPLSVAAAGFELLHFPIPPMCVPTPRACASLCAEIVDGLDRHRTLLHCRRGLGRTGTIAACCLINLGRSAEQALLEIRAVDPRYVQTPSQCQFIARYLAWLVDEPHSPW